MNTTTTLPFFPAVRSVGSVSVSSAPPLPSAVNILTVYRQPMDEKLLQELFGAVPSHVPVSIAEFRYLGKTYKGFAFRNVAGGYELFCDKLSQTFFTVGEYGLTVLSHGKKGRRHRCHVFETAADYLRFVSLDRHSISRDDDIVIMSNIRNFVSLLLFTDTYDSVQCYLQPSRANIIALATLSRRNDRVTDRSLYFCWLLSSQSNSQAL